MTGHRTDDGDARGGGASSAETARRSTDGGPPTVTDRGDDRMTAVDRWGQRAVHVLLVVAPAVLVGGLLARAAGAGDGATRAAAVLLGVVFAATALLALAVLTWRAVAGDRQTELGEFRSFEK